ncbi:hypothetical protein N9Y42_08810, partial [Mariniblastus sp.]|nr:hypothetical protein [Mariniblastus sp.]
SRITEWKPENYKDYLLFLLKPTKTGFTLHLLDEDFIKSEITAGRLGGEFMKEDRKKENKENSRAGKVADDKSNSFLVNAKPNELQAFFEKNLEEVAGEPFMFLKRVN